MIYIEIMKKFIASLALLQELYDEDIKIQDILALFIVIALTENGTRTFTDIDVQALLESKFEIKIPLAVVRDIIRSRLIRKWEIVDRGGNKKTYVRKNALPSEILKKLDIFKNEYDAALKNFRKVEKSFLEYAKSRCLLSGADDSALTDSLINYILNHEIEDISSIDLDVKKAGFINNRINKCVNLFIASLEDKGEIRSLLNDIRGGHIIYYGLQHQGLDEKIFQDELLFILDTEILFHASGLHGSLFKQLFEEFYTFVERVNAAKKKKLIRLAYTHDIRKELEDIFTYAEYVIEGTRQLEPGHSALENIVNGCSSKSCIRQKLSKMITGLSSQYGVNEIPEYSPKSKEYMDYNIIDQDFIDELVDECGRDADYAYKILSRINTACIARKGYIPSKIYKAKAILLTGKQCTIKAAIETTKRMSERWSLPCALGISQTTNTLWYLVGGGSSVPLSADIAVKAKVALSTYINRNIHDRYISLEQQVRNGELDMDAAKDMYVSLRSRTTEPDDIHANNVESYVDILLMPEEEYKNTISMLEAQREINSMIKKKAMPVLEQDLRNARTIYKWCRIIFTALKNIMLIAALALITYQLWLNTPKLVKYVGILIEIVIVIIFNIDKVKIINKLNRAFYKPCANMYNRIKQLEDIVNHGR
ncbi:MAG: hypothetical protein GXO35_07845 [Gammaproteobacteria bacterium]|nr:hypothetical protein [Gammaproteobacteria bacterium]